MLNTSPRRATSKLLVSQSHLQGYTMMIWERAVSQMASNIFCGGHGAAAQLVSAWLPRFARRSFQTGRTMQRRHGHIAQQLDAADSTATTVPEEAIDGVRDRVWTPTSLQVFDTPKSQICHTARKTFSSPVPGVAGRNAPLLCPFMVNSQAAGPGVRYSWHLLIWCCCMLLLVKEC